jgi:hypothetical protein
MIPPLPPLPLDPPLPLAPPDPPSSLVPPSPEVPPRLDPKLGRSGCATQPSIKTAQKTAVNRITTDCR